jgi:hypothetical protein
MFTPPENPNVWNAFAFVSSPTWRRIYFSSCSALALYPFSTKRKRLAKIASRSRQSA